MPGWSIDRVVAAAIALGVPTTEWGSGPGQAIAGREDARRAAELCAEKGLAISGLAVQDPAATLAQPTRCARFVRVAADLGAGHLRVFPPPYNGGRLAPAQARCRIALDQLVELAAPLGIRVLIEVAPATIAPTPELLVALLESHGPDQVGALYDPGNMAMEGHIEPRLAVEVLDRYLAHVHLKNVAWRWRAGAWQLGYANLSGGILDWPAIMAVLDGCGYRGLFAVDHLRGKATLRELRAEIDYLRVLLAR